MHANQHTDAIFRLLGTALFIAAISIPLVLSLVQPDQDYSDVEKRPLAQQPQLPTSVSELSSFPARFNSYYADQFGLRNGLNRGYVSLMFRVSPKSALREVTQGKDGWLFFGSPKPHLQGRDNPFGDARHSDLYSPKRLALAASRLQQRADWLRARGIDYVYAIAPNKHTIYFDQLPDGITKLGPVSSTDQLFNYLAENTDVEFVDLRPPLFAMKVQAPVYYKYDTHWNMLGASTAQYAIMSRVNELLPDSFPAHQLPNERFDFRQINKPGDLSHMVQLDDSTDIHPLPQFSGTCIPINRETTQDKLANRIITTCNTGKLTMLMYRDSMANALIEYFSKQFEIATYVWQRSDLASLEEELQRRKPNIVIEVVTERFLPYVPPDLATDPMIEPTQTSFEHH